MSEGEAPPAAPQPDDNAANDTSSNAEPYLITLPAERMRRLDFAHPDPQQAATVFAELFCMTSGETPRKDPRLAEALSIVQDALDVSRDQFHVALADVLGFSLDELGL